VSIEVDNTVLDNPQYYLNKTTGHLKFTSFISGGEVKITYTGGHDEIPDDVKLACLMQSGFIFQNRDTIGIYQAKTNSGDIKIEGKQDLLDGVKALLQPYKVVLI
jgi:hypothetical protein